MTTAAVRRSSAGSRPMATIAAAGLAAVVIVVIVAAIASSMGGAASTAPKRGDQAAALRQDRAALLAWEGDIVPLVQQGGRVVQDGMKPALDDLLYKHITPPAFIVREARAWTNALAKVRAQLTAVSAPGSMRHAVRMLDRALASYLRAARAFRAAAAHPAGATRRHFVRVGQRSGQAGDRIYDRAAAEIQQARARVGLPPDINFPTG